MHQMAWETKTPISIAILLTPTPSLGQVISEEIQANAYNKDVLR